MTRPTQPKYDSIEELNILMDLGYSEYHALTDLRISDGIIRGIISVEELYKDANTPASNINNAAKVDSKLL